MSDTQVLLSKIAALRQQLEQVQGLAQDGGSAPGAPPGEATDSAWRLQRLERQAKGGVQEHALLDTALRPMAPTPSPASACLPRQLTARARRILEEGRVLLGQLRLLADAFEPAPEAGYAVGPAAADPLTHRYHQTTAMADTALRLIQTFPDAPSAQLRLCEGIEAMLGIVAERVAGLSAAVEQRRQQDLQIETLAGLLTELPLGRSVDLQAFVALAVPLVQEPEDSTALLVRGDALIAKGDVASARLFYERAADAGDGQAALRLGESYDPTFLARAHLSAVRGDTEAAAHWYRRARELGTAEAEALLQTVGSEKDHRLP